MWKRRKEENRQRAVEERKCFVCEEFGHIVHHCRNVKEEGSVQMPSNIFEVLRDRVMQKREENGSEIRKDRKIILKEERTKRGIEI